MAEFTISVQVPEDLLPHLEAIAKARGLDEIGDLIGALTQEQIIRMQARINDPIIGAISSGQGDIASRDEDILRSEWLAFIEETAGSLSDDPIDELNR